MDCKITLFYLICSRAQGISIVKNTLNYQYVKFANILSLVFLTNCIISLSFRYKSSENNIKIPSSISDWKKGLNSWFRYIMDAALNPKPGRPFVCRDLRKVQRRRERRTYR